MFVRGDIVLPDNIIKAIISVEPRIDEVSRVNSHEQGANVSVTETRNIGIIGIEESDQILKGLSEKRCGRLIFTYQDLLGGKNNYPVRISRQGCLLPQLGGVVCE